MQQGVSSLSKGRSNALIIILGLLVSILAGVLGGVFGIFPSLFLIVLVLFIVSFTFFWGEPRLALVFLITYTFLMGFAGREIGGFPYGTLIEGLLVLTWIMVLFKLPSESWQLIKNDLCFLMLLWFIISVLEIANPAGASVRGWMQEIRTAALYPVLTVPLAFLLFNRAKDLNIFLILIIILSCIVALNGVKQLHIGLSAGEQKFLDANPTHLIWGQLRVFSFFSDAGQFGASQAQIGLMALILACGPFKTWKRVLLLIAAGLLFYGMLISGTRGALFVLVAGVFVALFLSKKVKALILGGGIFAVLLFILKFTHIGDGNYHIYRLRSAVDPQDASFNLRLYNQNRLKDYLSSRPFGGGLGVIGAWGHEYNSDKFLSTIEPDSYWVKVWAMYGIVGFIIWFGIMMYILGKCCGIVWNIENKGLRIKLIALTSGFAGIFLCSYGNEVINNMPSSIVVAISLAFVYMGPVFDKKMKTSVLKA